MDNLAVSRRCVAQAQTTHARQIAADTHKPNILDALGKDWFDVKEGEASIFRVDASGNPQLIGRVQVADWISAAGE